MFVLSSASLVLLLPAASSARARPPHPHIANLRMMEERSHKLKTTKETSKAHEALGTNSPLSQHRTSSHEHHDSEARTHNKVNRTTKEEISRGSNFSSSLFGIAVFALGWFLAPPLPKTEPFLTSPAAESVMTERQLRSEERSLISEKTQNELYSKY